MRRFRSAWWLVGAALVAGGWAVACSGPEFSASLFDKSGDDGEGGAATLSGGTAGKSPSLGDGGEHFEDGGQPGRGGEGGEGGEPEPTCPALDVDDAKSLFVSTEGEDSESCGSRDFPCKSVQRAIDRTLHEPMVHHVYVAPGTYHESIELRAGITVEGGVSASGKLGDFEWSVACKGTERAVIAGASVGQPTVLARDLSGAARLVSLTIETPEPGPSESSFGVMVLGASTGLAMSDVEVFARRGGDGLDGASGEAGSAGESSCTAGNATRGVDGADAVGPGPGEFHAELGFIPQHGADGEPGADGANGPSAEAPSAMNGGCVTCYNCVTVIGVGCIRSGLATNTCAERGTSGCGGKGGGAGAGGRGGGSSVALFVVDAAVEVQRGALVAGDGGRGGDGGAGGPGGDAGVGTPGADTATCRTSSCTSVGGCDEGVQGKGVGTKGTVGGPGGRGGYGSGGSGGHSFAIVELGDARVKLVGALRIEHGEAGRGGCPVGEPDDSPGCGADGLSGERYTEEAEPPTP